MTTGTTQRTIPILDLTPAKRCPEFDDDCADLDHFWCWTGCGILPPADGYCPFLVGEA